MKGLLVARLLQLSLLQSLRSIPAHPIEALVRSVLWVAILISSAWWASVAPDTMVLLITLAVSIGWIRVRLPAIAHQNNQGWLATLAISPVTRKLIVVIQTVLPVLVMLWLTLALAWIWGADSEIILWSALIGLMGAFVSAVFPHQASRRPYPDSRYRRGLVDRQAGASLKPIQSDLHAFVAARMRPEVLAKISVPFLLVMPNEVSLLTVLVLFLIVSALVYLGLLFSALPDFFRASQDWLASAPLTYYQLAKSFRHTTWPRLGITSACAVPFLTYTIGPIPGLLLAVLVLMGCIVAIEILIRIGLDGQLTPWLKP